MKYTKWVLGLCIVTLLVLTAVVVSAANLDPTVLTAAQALSEKPAGFDAYLEGSSFFARPSTYIVGLPILIAVVILVFVVSRGLNRRKLKTEGVLDELATTEGKRLFDSLAYKIDENITAYNTTYTLWNKAVKFCKEVWPRKVTRDLKDFDPLFATVRPGVKCLADLRILVVPAPAAADPITFSTPANKEKLIAWIETIDPAAAHPLRATDVDQAGLIAHLDRIKKWASFEYGAFYDMPYIPRIMPRRRLFGGKGFVRQAP